MTSNATTIRRYVHGLVSDALVAEGVLTADYFKRYATAPGDTDQYFGFVAGQSLDLEPGVIGGDFLNPILVIWGFARLSDDETVKEAAQDWLDDFEEVVISTLAEENTSGDILEIVQQGQPRRNSNPAYHGRFQTTAVIVEVMEK